MMRHSFRLLLVLGLALALLAVSGCRRRRYENPITKDTQQPDKVLFDKAIGDIERSRYEIARLTLQTLINTYDTSEYLAKAKLAIADSWFREGGSHGLAQAEAEYKDFILFYPTMEEAAEAQQKVCDIHYQPDGEAGPRHRCTPCAPRTSAGSCWCSYPNSKFAPEAQQMLRNIQEVLARARVPHRHLLPHQGQLSRPPPTACRRWSTSIPLFSQADEALWQLADSYEKMGDRFEDRAAAAYTRIVRDYPLSAARGRGQGEARRP